MIPAEFLEVIMEDIFEKELSCKSNFVTQRSPASLYEFSKLLSEKILAGCLYTHVIYES